MEKNPKAKKITFVIWVISVIIFIGLISVLLIYRYNEENMYDYPLSGIYQDFDKTLFVYQYSDMNLSFVFYYNKEELINNIGFNKNYGKRRNVGKLSINGSEATGINSGKNYTFSFIDNTLNANSVENEEINGNYKKINNLKIQEFFDYAFGDSNLFNSEYNGIYVKDGEKILAFQKDENSVFFIFNLVKMKQSLTIDIVSEDTLASFVGARDYNITLNDKNLNVKIKTESEFEEYQNQFKRKSKLKYIDVLDNDILYFY